MIDTETTRLTLSELRASLRGAGVSTAICDREQHADELDAALESGAVEIDSRLSASSAAELRAIDDALVRLSAGEYGTCQDCGLPIAPERLEALPAAVLCRDCQASDEQRHDGQQSSDWTRLGELADDSAE